ncbi:MAG TPA: hypothetical protein DDW51_05665 [Cyanobacteria bacterium UBA11367]|nr:hypothetical protein [Cyanobacteria bacterium UBA11367]
MNNPHEEANAEELDVSLFITMLFTSLHTQTSEAIENCEILIEQLKDQLAIAQEQLSQFQQQQQAELSAEAAASTALEMVFKARRMIKAAYPNSPEALTEFDRALVSDRNIEPPILPSAPSPTPSPTPQPTPQPTPSPTPPTLAELNNMTKRELQDIARNYGTRYTGTKEAIINGIINQ